MSIEVKHLTHIYNKGLPDETRALDDVSFSADNGQFIGIIGHTGSGKSTLLQHLNCLLRPDEGSVIVDGVDILSEKTAMKEIRCRVGLVFQYPEYQLFEETVEKDVAFGPHNLGLSDQEISRRVREALELVGLDFEKVRDLSPFELSGGQKRRAAIAGVIAMKPQVLVLDEPTAGLNPKAHKDILDMVSKIHRISGGITIFVSHNMNDVARMSDKVIVMDSGRVAMQGSPEEVFAHEEELKAIGLALPDNMEIASRLRKAGFEIGNGCLTTDQLADAIVGNLR